MLSELTDEVKKAFEAQLDTCEVLCFATGIRRSVVSVLIVDSVLTIESSVDYLEHEGRKYEVLSVQALRTLFHLERIETFTAFLRDCVVLKDEYRELFDAMQATMTIVLNQPDVTSEAGQIVDCAGPGSIRDRGGYFSTIVAGVARDPQNHVGYKVLCSGVPYLHRFIKRQGLDLLGELRDVTRIIEFAFYRNGRLPQSTFSLEFYNIDHLNKPEFEKRLSLFCATRNKYPSSIHFRLFRSNFGNEPRSAFMRSVSLKMLADYIPRTSSPQGFLRAISPTVTAILLSILKGDNLGTARARLDELVRLQLRHIIAHKILPGEITNQEKIAYQLDLHTDTMVMTQKAILRKEIRRHVRTWGAPMTSENEVFHSFKQWQDLTRPSHTAGINLLFDSFCISPYSGYYFLRLIQVLLNEKA